MRKNPSSGKGLSALCFGSERSGLYRKFFELIQFGQYLRIGGNFPLLGTNIGKLHNTLLVDDEQSRALAERDHPALHIVLLIDFQGIIYQSREWHRVLLEEALGIHHCIGGDDDDFGVSFLKKMVVLAQLLQMPAAEWSKKSPQKDENHVLLTQELV